MYFSKMSIKDTSSPVQFIINRSDAIGDLVLSLPVAQVLKKHYPNSTVTFIVSERNKDVVDHCPFVDSRILLPKRRRWSFFREFNSTIRGSQSIFIHLGGSQLPIITSFFCGMSKRFGLKNKISGFLLNKGLRQSRSRALMSEVEYNLSLIQDLAPVHKLDKSNLLVANLTPEHSESFESLKRNNNGEQAKRFFESNKKIIIHPGMSGHTLNWPIRNYARLIKKILDQNSEIAIGISYTTGDLKILDPFFRQLEQDNLRLNKNIFEIKGETWGLSGYLQILSQANLFIGPSTGPTHLAAALGLKVFGFYSPIKTQSSLRWGPISICPEHKILVPDVICGESQYCAEKDCFYYECMAKIEVNQVMHHLKHHIL